MTGCAGVILAGGVSRRMGGGDKSLITIAGATMLARVKERLMPQAAPLAINANGDPSRFSAYGLPVIADTVPGHPGPLAGVLAGLDWSRQQGLDWCLTVAADLPLLPLDLSERLRRSLGRSRCAIAASDGRVHPVCGLWSVELIPAVVQSLAADQRGIWKFAQAAGCQVADWPSAPQDPFMNVNTPEDAEKLSRHLIPAGQ